MTDSTDKKTDPLKVTVGTMVAAFAILCMLVGIHDHDIPAAEKDIRLLGYALDNLKTQLKEKPAAEPTPHDWEGIANVLQQTAGDVPVTIEFDGVTIKVGDEDRR